MYTITAINETWRNTWVSGFHIMHTHSFIRCHNTPEDFQDSKAKLKTSSNLSNRTRMITSNSNWIASCIWLQLPGISQTARHWQRHQQPLARHSWQLVWGPWQNQDPMGPEAPVHALPPVQGHTAASIDSTRLIIKKSATRTCRSTTNIQLQE